MFGKQQNISFELPPTAIVHCLIQMDQQHYVIHTEEQPLQTLKSIVQKNYQLLTLHQLVDDQLIALRKHEINQGLSLLSNILKFDSQFIVALISRAGVRSIIKFNMMEGQHQTMVDTIPYKQHHGNSIKSKYQVFLMNSIIWLVQFHYYTCEDTDKYMILTEITIYNKNQRFQQFFYVPTNASDIQAQQIIGDNGIAIVFRDKFIKFKAQTGFQETQIMQHDQFKIKYIVSVENKLMLLMKDKIDKFYKTMIVQDDHVFVQTLKHKESLTIDPQLVRKSCSNLILNGDYYVLISSIYKQQDKIDKQLEVHPLDGFKLFDAKDIKFLQHDQVISPNVFYQFHQNIKMLNLLI